MDIPQPKTSREIDREKPFSIYQITNKVNGKRYIGQTVSPIMRRWYSHVFRALHDKNTHSPIGCAIRKYGKENFEIIRIDRTDNMNELNSLEEKYILELETSVPNGYNIRPGGSNSRHAESTKEKMRQIRTGTHVSEESRRKMSESHKGRIPWNIGKSLTAEHKKKISESGKGRVVSDETRAYLSNLHRGKLMHPVTDEMRKKIGEASKRNAHLVPHPKGRRKSAEECRAISERQIGHIVTEETREKIRQKLKGRKLCRKGKEAGLGNESLV